MLNRKTTTISTTNNPTENFNQMLLLDRHAMVIESCDTLFRVNNQEPATVWSPFIESIFSYLWTLQTGTPEVLFSRVEEPLNELQGFYDFTFNSVTISGEKYILWTIFDYTMLYKEFQRNQQRMNELELQRQNLNSKIHYIIRKNLTLQQLILSKNLGTNSMLLKANNLLLKNIFVDLEQLTDLVKYKYVGNWVDRFSLTEVILNIKESFESIRNQKIIVEVSKRVSQLKIMGDQSRLMYILYDLLSLSNQASDSNSSCKIEEQGTMHPDLIIRFTIKNTRLKMSNIDLFKTKKEHSVESEPFLFRLNLVSKLIGLQSGKFHEIKSEEEGTQFVFEIPFAVLPQ